MRILMVARRFPPDVISGTETVFANLLAQARTRHEVRLVVGFRNDPEGFPEDAVPVDLRRGGPGAYLAMRAAAAREARRFRPDVVLSNSVEVTVPGLPNALIVHDLNFGKADRDVGSFLRERLYRWQGGRVACVIAVSEATRRRLHAIGVPRVVVIPNGVDVERFVPRSTPSALVRFVYPARILPGKGQHAAIDALGRMRPDIRRRARLTIVGAVADRIYADRIRIQAYNLPVDFALDVGDIVPFYQDADVVLFPTLMEEGFGFTAVEGMACGKPVIYYDQPAIREATGGIGIGVPADDADALRNAMIALMDDPERREALGRAGRAFVETRAWARVWERYETLLRDTCRTFVTGRRPPNG